MKKIKIFLLDGGKEQKKCSNCTINIPKNKEQNINCSTNIIKPLQTHGLTSYEPVNLRSDRVDLDW